MVQKQGLVCLSPSSGFLTECKNSLLIFVYSSGFAVFFLAVVFAQHHLVRRLLIMDFFFFFGYFRLINLFIPFVIENQGSAKVYIDFFFLFVLWTLYSSGL